MASAGTSRQVWGVTDVTGGKGIGAGSSSPKGPGTDDSISGVSPLGGVFSLE